MSTTQKKAKKKKKITVKETWSYNEALNVFYEYAGKSSQFIRQLAFAGIAILWAFSNQNFYDIIYYTRNALICFIGSLLFDLMHLLWKGYSIDRDIQKNLELNKASAKPLDAEIEKVILRPGDKGSFASEFQLSVTRDPDGKNNKYEIAPNITRGSNVFFFLKLASTVVGYIFLMMVIVAGNKPEERILGKWTNLTGDTGQYSNLFFTDKNLVLLTINKGIQTQELNILSSYSVINDSTLLFEKSDTTAGNFFIFKVLSPKSLILTSKKHRPCVYIKTD